MTDADDGSEGGLGFLLSGRGPMTQLLCPTVPSTLVASAPSNLSSLSTVLCLLSSRSSISPATLSLWPGPCSEPEHAKRYNSTKGRCYPLDYHTYQSERARMSERRKREEKWKRLGGACCCAAAAAAAPAIYGFWNTLNEWFAAAR